MGMDDVRARGIALTQNLPYGFGALGVGKRGVALAHRAIHHARLAEPAAARTPAQDLDVQAVVDELGIRHDDRLVRNHGPFSWGKNAAAAVYHAVVIEEVAKMATLPHENGP